jgi:predicted transcriptional regulator
MQVLWTGADRDWTGRQVSDAFPGYAYTTIATVLDRLVDKGVLGRVRNGRVKRYAVARGPGDHTAAAMRALLAACPDPDGALRRFAETMTPTEAATVHSVIPDHHT